MSDRPELIQRRLAGLEDIGQVVAALRAIASGNAAGARDGVAAIRSYSAILAQALNRASGDDGRSSSMAGGDGGAGLILVIGAAQGFSGAYPSRIAAATREARAAGTGDAALVVLGARSLSMLDHADRAAVVHSADLPSQAAQVPALASQITDALAVLAARYPGPIRLVAGRDLPGQPVTIGPLWPPPATPATAPGPAPLTNLPAAELVDALLREALFAAVALALMEGYRAENQARFEAMARAQSHLRDKLAEVSRDYQQARQEQMTTELIELASAT